MYRFGVKDYYSSLLLAAHYLPILISYSECPSFPVFELGTSIARNTANFKMLCTAHFLCDKTPVTTTNHSDVAKHATLTSYYELNNMCETWIYR